MWTIDEARAQHARAWAVASAAGTPAEALAALANAHDTLVLAIGELQAEIAELRAGDAVRRIDPAAFVPERVNALPVGHPYEALQDVTVRVCRRCGMWPDHPIHG